MIMIVLLKSLIHIRYLVVVVVVVEGDFRYFDLMATLKVKRRRRRAESNNYVKSSRQADRQAGEGGEINYLLIRYTQIEKNKKLQTLYVYVSHIFYYYSNYYYYYCSNSNI